MSTLKELIVSSFKQVINVTETRANVYFRANAGPGIGYGHLVRCSALAEAFRNCGFRPVFITNASHGILKNNNFNHLIVPENQGQTLDPSSEAFVLKNVKAPLLVVDSYQADKYYIQSMRKHFKKILCIDDTMQCPEGADIVLNGNIYGDQMEYPESYGMVLGGGAYCLIREAFKPYLERVKEHRKLENLLIIMGGSDPSNLSIQIVENLFRCLPDLKYHVVIGEGYPWKTEIPRMKALSTVHKNPEHIEELMFKMDLAISAAGSTVYELAALGVPSINITVAQNQEKIAEEIAAKGFSISLGYMDAELGEKVCNAVEKLVNSEDLRIKMAACGRQNIDGNGAMRAAQKVIEICGMSQEGMK